jgi:polyphenol oxidase
MVRELVDGLPVWRFPRLAAPPGLDHGVTTRHGGTSGPPYASLNLGLHVGDAAEAVIANRRRVCAALGVPFESYTLARQVHGSGIARVGAEQIGAGRAALQQSLPDADGLVVTQPGVLISVLSADCVPLLLYDPVQHVGAAVHAGWRGTAAGIAGAAVRYLVGNCGCRPRDLLVGLGPAIGPCCYQVSADVAEQLSTAFPYARSVATTRDGAWYLDLAQANRQQLLAAGVPEGQCEEADLCTSCHAGEFFSERKLGRPTGRISAFLVLTEQEGHRGPGK